MEDELDPPSLGYRADPVTSAWSQLLHDADSLSPDDTSPDTSQIHGPSNEVLSALSTNINVNSRHIPVQLCKNFNNLAS